MRMNGTSIAAQGMLYVEPNTAWKILGEREFEVSSTPTLIINGQKHRGAATFQELDKVLKPLVGRS